MPMAKVLDITVEGSSVEFQRIRDYVDAMKCQSLPAFEPAKLLQGYVSQCTITE